MIEMDNKMYFFHETKYPIVRLVSSTPILFNWRHGETRVGPFMVPNTNGIFKICFATCFIIGNKGFHLTSCDK